MYCVEKATVPPLNPPVSTTAQPTTTKPWTISTAPNQCKSDHLFSDRYRFLGVSCDSSIANEALVADNIGIVNIPTYCGAVQWNHNGQYWSWYETEEMMMKCNQRLV